VGIVLFHAALTFAMGAFAVLPGAALARMRGSLSHRVGFPLIGEAFDDALGTKAAFRGIHGWPALVASIDSVCTVLPALTAFIAFTLRTLNRAPWFVIGAAFVASVSPLAMHALAADMPRWDTIALVTSFLSAYLACTWLRRSACDRVAAWWNGPVYVPLLVALVALNGSSMTVLFDGEHVKQFPFFEHRHHLVEWLRTLKRH
jgi:hypothetical protein